MFSRLPGPEFALFACFFGGLFSACIHAVNEQLALQASMWHGAHGDFADNRGRALVEGRGNRRLTVFETAATPHFARSHKFGT